MFLPDLAHNTLNTYYTATKRRYSRYPIHDFCYKQSYLPQKEALVKLPALLNSEASSDAILLRVDAAGMTAFHVLALSSRPEIGLFRILQSYSSPNNRWPMDVPDRWGIRPIQYIYANSSVPMSERKRLVEYLFEATVMYRAHKLELPDWRVAVISKARELFFAKEENMTLEKSRGVDAICHILERHELMEILSSLELRIWSCKLLENEIDEGPAGDILDVCQPKRVKLDDREFARVNCGADIIIGNILPFLREPS